jgi:hypothetical protein
VKNDMRRTLVLLLSFAGTFGCEEPFDPYNRLTAMRVLAIRADPPLPAPGETSTLSALVYSTPEDPPVSYRWSWCPLAGPPEAGHPCLISDQQLAELGQAAGVTLPGFELGDQPTAQLTHAIDPAILTALCEGEGLSQLPQLPSCEGGFPVQIKVIITSATKTETAVRNLRLRLSAIAAGNTNPTIEGLLARPPEQELQPLDEQAMMTLPRNKKTVIRAVVPETTAEEYDGLDNDRRPARVHEVLALTWFVESGTTDSERTSFVFGEVSLADALENEWTPARTKDYAGSRSRIIVVIRDNRGGVAWREGSVMLGETP